MKKSLKMRLVALLSCAFMLLLGAALVTASFATAADADFYMSGVALRSEKTEDGEYGLKFYGYVSASKYDSSYEYGMEIAPADKLDSAKTVTCTPKADEKNSGLYVITGAVTDIVAANTSRPFTARAFYSAGEGEKVYTEWAEAKSIYTVATQALADDSAELTDEIKAYLNGIVDGVQGKNAANGLTGKYVINEITVESNGANFADKEFNVGDTFTVNASVKKEGEETKILKAYPTTVKLLDYRGNDISDSIRKVQGTQNEYFVSTAFGKATFSATVGTGEYSVQGETSDSYYVRAYKATVTDNNVTLKKGTADNAVEKPYAEYGYYGVGEVTENDTLIIKFTGKNIPSIAMFADSLGGKAIGGGTGVYIATDSRNGTWRNRLNVNGKYRQESGIASDYATYQANNEFKNGQVIWDTSNTGNTSLISYGKVEDGVNYVLTASYKFTADKSKVNIILNLYKEVDGKFTLAKNFETNYRDFNLDNFDNKNVILYSAYGDESESITFEYEISNSAKTSYRAFNNSDGSVFLAKGSETLSASGNVSDYSYISAGAFNVGDTIEIEWEGKKVPNIAMLTDTEYGQAIGGGKGYMWFNVITGYLDNTSFTGSNRIETGNPADYSSYATNFSNGGNGSISGRIATETTPWAYNNLTDGTKYKLMIKVTVNNTPLIIFYTTFYTFNEETGKYEVTKERGQTANPDANYSLEEKRYAIIYGNSQRDISFTYKVITSDT